MAKKETSEEIDERWAKYQEKKRRALGRFTERYEPGDLPPAKEYGGIKPGEPGWLEAMCKAKGIPYG